MKKTRAWLWISWICLIVFVLSTVSFFFVYNASPIHYSLSELISNDCDYYGTGCIGQPAVENNLSILINISFYSFLFFIIFLVIHAKSKRPIDPLRYSFSIGTVEKHDIKINIWPLKEQTMDVFVDGKNIFNQYVGTTGELYSGIFVQGLNKYNFTIGNSEKHTLEISVTIPYEVLTLTLQKAYENDMKYECTISVDGKKIVDNNVLV